jgi:hypothetical protein
MNYVRYRLYLGLSIPDGGMVNPFRAVEIVVSTFDAFTTFDAKGFWQGRPEPCLVFEILTEEPTVKVRNLARRLQRTFKQTSVLLTTDTVKVDFV